MTTRAHPAVERSPGRIRLTGRAGLLGAILLVLAATAVVPLREYAAERERVRAVEQRVAALQREHDALRARVRQLRDPAYLERLARECLGMVEPGEIAFVAVPETGTLPDPRC